MIIGGWKVTLANLRIDELLVLPVKRDRVGSEVREGSLVVPTE
jgi:hypothetical protein